MLPSDRFGQCVHRRNARDLQGIRGTRSTYHSLLALGNLLNGLMHLPYYAQLAHGWTGLSIRINIVAVLIIVPAILWATPIYDAEGAAWVCCLKPSSTSPQINSQMTI